MRRIGLWFALGTLALSTPLELSGCGGTANVAGNYSLAVTNQDNGCSFDNWTVGQMTNGVPLVVTQSGENATATLQGLVGAYVQAAFGSASFTGTVDGLALALKLFGTRNITMGSCSYTVNAEVAATINGDVLTGTIEYKPATNGSPECGAIMACVSRQAFNGTRPPAP